jgi:hypothetical protein
MTTALGQILREFATITSQTYSTRELPREAAARARALAKTKSGTSSAAKEKHFNMYTPKIHALGDYVAHIYQFGTTDSYSTQSVCIKGPFAS